MFWIPVIPLWKGLNPLYCILKGAQFEFFKAPGLFGVTLRYQSRSLRVHQRTFEGMACGGMCGGSRSWRIGMVVDVFHGEIELLSVAELSKFKMVVLSFTFLIWLSYLMYYLNPYWWKWFLNLLNILFNGKETTQNPLRCIQISGNYKNYVLEWCWWQQVVVWWRHFNKSFPFCFPAWHFNLILLP